MSRKIDLTGKTFGRLTVVEHPNGSSGKVVCRCTCGTVKSVYAMSLKSGKTKSCGCLQKEIVARQSDERRAYRNEVMAVFTRGEDKWANYRKHTWHVCERHGTQAIVLYRSFTTDFENECPLCCAREELDIMADLNDSLPEICPDAL